MTRDSGLASVHSVRYASQPVNDCAVGAARPRFLELFEEHPEFYIWEVDGIAGSQLPGTRVRVSRMLGTVLSLVRTGVAVEKLGLARDVFAE
jgi:hypothetical protein